MTPAKFDIAMQSQTGIAKKIYECVPIQQAWQTFQISHALKNMTGSQADVRVVQGCLNDLVESGLVRETQGRYYQRVKVEEKQKPKELKMPAPKEAKPAVEAAPSGPIEVLGALSAEIVGMAEHMKKLARRVEDAALAIEQARESDSESTEKLRQLASLLKSMQ